MSTCRPKRTFHRKDCACLSLRSSVSDRKPCVEQLVERARAEVALGHPGDGLDVAQAARAGLDVRFEVVGGVVGLEMPVLLLGDLGFEVRLAPARRDRPTRPRASSASNCALPASRRASISVVMTPTSAALSSAHSATVRTLWPTSRLMSHRKVTTRSTTPRPASSGAAGTRIRMSTSECGCSSPRP